MGPPFFVYLPLQRTLLSYLPCGRRNLLQYWRHYIAFVAGVRHLIAKLLQYRAAYPYWGSPTRVSVNETGI